MPHEDPLPDLTPEGLTPEGPLFPSPRCREPSHSQPLRGTRTGFRATAREDRSREPTQVRRPCGGREHGSDPRPASQRECRGRRRGKGNGANWVAVAIEEEILSDLFPREIDYPLSAVIVPTPGIQQRKGLVRGIVTEDRITVIAHDPQRGVPRDGAESQQSSRGDCTDETACIPKGVGRAF